MKKYRGYYIDGIVFSSEKEIDAFLKAEAIKSFRRAVQNFVRRPSMEASLYTAEKAEYLNNLHGMDWDEIEQIELDTMRACKA